MKSIYEKNNNLWDIQILLHVPGIRPFFVEINKRKLTNAMYIFFQHEFEKILYPYYLPCEIFVT